MAVPDSWIETGRGAAPVGEVAARVLRRRLDTVWSALRAACRGECDAGTVHGLRVATRRALAAFEVFADAIPGRSRDWFEKRLARVRRVAGEARDLDVLGEHLSAETAVPVRARDRLVAMLSRRRIESRSPIREQLEKLVDADWPRRCDRLVAAVRRRSRRRRFTTFARRRFRPMIGEFFAGADRKLRSADDLHAMRIAGKRLRYAFEILAPALPPRVRGDCQESLERLQESLGEYTDHAAAADRLARWARSGEAGSSRDLLEALQAREDARAQEARKTFSRWWNQARRRTLRRRFEKTLRRHPA